MKLEEAIEQLDRSTGSEASVQEERAKRRFSMILQEVKYKDFSPEQMQVLEAELDGIFQNLDLGSTGVQRQLASSQVRLIRFLRSEFAFLPEGHFAHLGMWIGISVGTLLLLYFISFTSYSVPYYSPLGGFLMGSAVGSLYDRSFKRKGRTFLTKTG